MFRSLNVHHHKYHYTDCLQLPHNLLLAVYCFTHACRKWCKLGTDPKDAEEFIDQACKDGRIMPNAATVNNLNKLWDTHEQLHG